MKIAIINSHPIQYFAPLYKQLANGTSNELKVYYCSRSGIDEQLDPEFGQKIKWDIPLLEGYQYEFIKNISPIPGPGRGFLGIVNPSIISLLRKDKPDILIIHGWAYVTYILALLYGLFSKARVFIKTESPLNQELMSRSVTSKLKRSILKYLIFPKIDAFLHIGNQNKYFYKHLNVPDSKLFFTPYCVDNNRFRNAYNQLKNGKSKLRKKLNIPENSIVFISSGKLIHKKKPLDLIKAMKRVNNSNAYLILLGDGSLRSEIDKEIKHNQLQDQIKITGFINQSQLPDYYTASDVFILPSTVGETWGLVSNEAMNFNLPLIISDIPGSAYDLVNDGQNGFIYPCGDVNDLSKKMNWFISNREKIPEMGRISGNLVKRYSYANVINGIIKACDAQL